MHAAGPDGAPPVLLIHGWAQSARCWQHQLTDPHLTAELRLLAIDLRGHGGSDAPRHGYDDPQRWAGDVHAVLTALADRPAVLVGWSYGGLVIGDYLARHGTAAVAGVLLTGAITGLGRDVPAGRIGPAMRAALPAVLAEDPRVAVPALAALTASMPAQPLPGEEEQRLLAAALSTPPRVRAALFERHVDGARFAGAIGAAPRPLIVQHGTGDQVVDQATARHHLATFPGAEADWWPGVGHLPFAEDPPRFNRTLRTFARHCMGERERMVE